MSSGPLALDRALDTRIELDGPQVDVLVEVEAEAEQDSLFENAGGHVGVADGTEQDGVAAAQPLDLGVGQDFAGLQVAFAAQVEGDCLEVECPRSGRRRRAPRGPRPSPRGRHRRPPRRRA